MLEVVASASDYLLTTLENVKDTLQIQSAADDDFLNRLIKSRSGRAATWCRRVFASEGVRQTVRRQQRNYSFAQFAEPSSIELDRFPVSSVASVKEDGITRDPSQYEVDSASGLLWRLSGSGCRIAWCATVVCITYTAGYQLPGWEPIDGVEALPGEIEEAAIEIVRQSYLERTRDRATKAEDIPGVRSVQYWVGPVPGADEDADIPDGLRPYRLQRV